MNSLNDVKNIVINTLQLGEHAAHFDENTFLLGSLAELDSVTVISVITEIEEFYGLKFDDSEINGDVFATLGSLAATVDQKLSQIQ
ncbi:phosphopantetheine-binding protein [Undibacterium sp. SXout20W]|uniref:phosphopantetheine-binding protein n=1 Tax=Undibacterium sp. SXout20W TaxID=3413051 RepID=UPI003BEF64B2